MSIQDKFNRANVIYKITKDIDLGGETLTIPEGCTLDFQGGSFSNGTIVGNNTKINADTVSIFNNISILGTYNCPNVYSYWFNDISNVNKIRDLFALCDNNVHNNVYLHDTIYPIELNSGNNVGVEVTSNTHIELNGTIQTITDMINYNIIKLYNVCNVFITGSGCIDGGRLSHAENTGGEWGHGIMLQEADLEKMCKNICIKDITITQCWGDGMHIFGKNVTIKNVTINNCRRQGISVGYTDNLIIDNCRISDISGTAPQFAIDIEPVDSNISETANNVYIVNNIIDNSRGILLAYAESIDNVFIKNNIINTSELGIWIADERGESAVGYLKKCIISNNNILNSNNNGYAILAQNETESLLIDGNNIYGVISIKEVNDIKSVTISNNRILNDATEINHNYMTHLIGNVNGNTINGGFYISRENAIINNNIFNVNKSFKLIAGGGTFANNTFNISQDYTHNAILNCSSSINFVNNIINNNNDNIAWIVGQNFSGAVGLTSVLNNYIFGNMKIRPHYTSVSGDYNCRWRYPLYIHNGSGGIIDNAVPDYVDVGQYKMENGKPVFWDKTRWVDATGAEV